MNIVSLVTRMVDPIRNMWNKRDQIGASLVEYALLLALIAVVALVALHFLGWLGQQHAEQRRQQRQRSVTAPASRR